MSGKTDFAVRGKHQEKPGLSSAWGPNHWPTMEVACFQNLLSEAHRDLQLVHFRRSSGLTILYQFDRYNPFMS